MMRYLLIILFTLNAVYAYSQSTRELVNEGVDLYNKKEFIDSEVNFLKGLEKAPDNFEAKFNLGDAYYKQQKYEDAVKTFSSALEQTDNKDLKSRIYHNIGNSLLKSQKYPESIEAYKNALKHNPDDEDTKYNLSYALSMMNNQNQQKQDQKNDKNKDEDKKDEQDQQQQEGDQNKDQQKEQQDQQNKSGEDESTRQDNLKQPQKNEISKEEAQRILDALKNNEKDLQKKLRKKAGTPVYTEKDW